MLNVEEIISLPQNEDEAILLLSSLGFDMKDWPFIERMGGAKEILSSRIIDGRLKTAAITYPGLKHFFSTLRERLEVFYEKGGFLLTPKKCQSSLFLTNDSPLVFFGRGDFSVLSIKPAVAIVGSRQASKPALEWTKTLSENLAKAQVLVVSGGANGIDLAAHQGAFDGSTAIILGVPCDLKNDERPSRINEFVKEGAISISPFGPWQPIQKYMFVRRNLFVVALADALVVVQGKAGSGTLHTVKYALELKKTVFALPGAIENPLSFVPNHLLEKGCARAILGHEELLKMLNIGSNKASIKKELAKKPKEIAKKPYLLQLLADSDNALSTDEIIHLSGWSLSDIQTKMLEYEIEGLVKKRGSQFVLLSS